MSATHLLGDILAKVSEIGRTLTVTDNKHETLIDRCMLLISGEGEASGLALGREILDRYRVLNTDQKLKFFHQIMEKFGADLEQLSKIIAKWQPENNNELAHQIHFTSEPKSQELIRRLNRAPGGTRDLVSMRRDLLLIIAEDASLKRLDADFSHLLGSWFNRGFLELRRIDWNRTPALILEKIIAYEAVHEINGWDDLRLRVAAQDRRLYGFFHPALGDDPLIFLEVALTTAIPTAVAPILTKQRKQINPNEATTAVFYSISNCQMGLQGISFGNFLLKQVVEELRREFSNLGTFVTLSPIPGMRNWAQKQLDPGNDSELSTELLKTIESISASPDLVTNNETQLKKLTAHYLLNAKRKDGSPYDPVARFHLGNGARLEQLNLAANTDDRGMLTSWGVMVNYLYDLGSIERNHEAYANRHKVICSRTITRLLK